MSRLLLRQLKKNKREINLTKKELKVLENRLGTFSIIIRKVMDLNLIFQLEMSHYYGLAEITQMRILLLIGNGVMQILNLVM